MARAWGPGALGASAYPLVGRAGVWGLCLQDSGVLGLVSVHWYVCPGPVPSDG